MLTNSHSLCIDIGDWNVSVGHSHQRGENLSVLGSGNQLEPTKHTVDQIITNSQTVKKRGFDYCSFI